MRIASTAALALAAASTGVIIPTAPALVGDSSAVGLFNAAHVVGGVLGAALGARALRRTGSARSLAIAALTTSVILILAIALASSLELRIGLRLADGGCHLLAITALIATATSGDATSRARRAVAMGVAIVLGIAAGLGLGGVIGHLRAKDASALLGHPEAAVIVAAVLSAAALVIVLARVADEPSPIAATKRSTARGPIAPAVLAFGERFIFGTLAVATPFLAPAARVGMVLGIFMVASVIALPVARRYALTWGPRRLAVRSAAVFVLGLLPCAFIDVFASIGIALAWAIVCGGAAGALYAAALVFAARSSVVEERVRDMAALHAAGDAGHAVGALCAGVLHPLLPGALVIALPAAPILMIAALAVWVSAPVPSDPAPRQVG